MTTFTSPTAYVLSTTQAGFVATQGWMYGFKDLRDALVACGMVQTADTGQVDFTANAGSATAPAALGAYVDSGYFIVRLNDALAASKPVYVKVRLFTLQYNAFGGISLEVGEGSDGAGNLTGRRVSKTYVPFTSNSNGLYWTTNAATLAAGSGTEAFVAWHLVQQGENSSSTNSAVLSIERTRNADGAADGEGVLLLVGSGMGWHVLAFPTNASTPANSVNAVTWIRNVLPVRRASGINSYVNGNDVGPLPPLGGAFFPAFRHTTGLYLLRAPEIPNDTIFTAQVPGGTRTFRAIGGSFTAPFSNFVQTFADFWGSENTQKFSLAMLWE